MRMRRALTACVVAVAIFGCAPVAAKERTTTQGDQGAERPALGAPTIAVEPGEHGTRLRATVPGRIAGYAFARSPGGTRVVLLVDPGSGPAGQDAPSEEKPGEARPMPPCPGAGETTRGPMEIQAFDATDPSGIAHVADAPADARHVDTADLDGDGVDEILVGTRGALLRVDPDGGLSTLLADDALAGKEGGLEPRAVTRPSVDRLPMLTVPQWGAIELVGVREDGGWGPLARAELPLAGEAGGGSDLVVSTIVPRLVGRTADGAWVLATKPEQVDDLRLRVRLVTLRPSGESSVQDCWARLPGPEDLVEWSFLLVDDRPVLVAVTKPADKLSLFADRGLRLYALEPDRSRLGRPPFLVTETAANLMQETKPLLVDVDGDGAEDLVIAYYKGLIGSEVALEAYLRGEGLTFDDRRRTTSFGVKEADESFLEFGRDLDGDGIGDLVVRSGDRYLVFPGRRSENGKKLVARDAIEVPSAVPADIVREVWIGGERGGGSRKYASVNDVVVDVDGDGIAEIVTIDPGAADRPATFALTRLAPPPPTPD